MMKLKGAMDVDQKKIGSFLKDLRKGKGCTQEQLAERLGVSNRTVSRWENGNNLPDFDLLLALAGYYEVTLEEILTGKRSETPMDKDPAQTMEQITDYTNTKRMEWTQRLHLLFLLGTVGALFYGVVLALGLAHQSPYEEIGSFGLGLACGMLLLGTLFTSRFATRLLQTKLRLLHRGAAQESPNKWDGPHV